MGKRGISLIVLVITIIVMIILSIAVVITLSSSGIIGNANEAVFKQNIKAYIQEFEIYKLNYIGIHKGELKDLNVNSQNIQTVITSIPQNLEYKEKLEIKSGIFMYILNNKDELDVKRAVWACEVGLKVEGIDKCSDIQYKESHETSYSKVGDIYYNTPDITGFNVDTTYFVTYDEAGNETIGDNITNKAPSNWHDYENKQWANLVTIKESEKAYMVWIPRYAYKVDSSGKVVDIRFVTRDNLYKDNTGTTTKYSDKVPTFDESGNQTNYVVSSVFTVDMSDEGKENIELAGYWLGKYEISECNISQFTTIRSTDNIKISGITSTSLSSYDYYIDGILKNSSADTTYTFSGLNKDSSYLIKIVGKDALGNEVAQKEQSISTLGDNTNGITGFSADAYGGNIEIFDTKLNSEANQNPTKIYEFYLDNNLITSNTTGKHVFKDLTGGSVHMVNIKIKDNSNYYGSYTRTFTVPNMPKYNAPNSPDLTGLNLSRTYYVTYDESGNETRTIVQGNTAPTNWYNYSEKKWANIVVVDNTTSAEAYMVWIPKYEYRIVGSESNVESDKRVDISFIPASQLVPTEGYTIGSVFTVDMTDDGGSIKHLEGYWMAKYEISEQ